MTDAPIPTIVLGGTGYVAGELLRLLVSHPRFTVAGVLSESRAGQGIRDAFPQLQSSLGDARFMTRGELMALLGPGPTALFSAAPHGASAALIAEFIRHGKSVGCDLSVVDVSADFRFSDADAYAGIYGTPHGAPDLLAEFVSALPEHLPSTSVPHIGHPGCFATALLMACVPLMKLGITHPDLYASGITGSTGSGRTPGSGTHHPERHSNLYAYKALAHRHAPEVTGICERLSGTRPNLHFVPHSGPFARGIYLTVQAKLRKEMSEAELRAQLAGFYSHSEFVSVCDGMPRLKDIVGSNYCHIGVAVDQDSAAIFVAIDNLVKGAAGGAVQWMNRLHGLPENAGLTAPAIGWT
jgi:N-acetyl-gamma-glutamyl-phosphate reductase